jgi:hypothetical protein
MTLEKHLAKYFLKVELKVRVELVPERKFSTLIHSEVKN